jgi:hypothetical protein
LLAGLAAERGFGQYDKVAALGSDSSLTPIGGPASSPPISNFSYDLPDFRPTGALNDRLPAWLRFGVEERLRLETSNDSSYLLNRLRVGMALQPASWFKLVAQTQDARSLFQAPPFGPPNNVRWDLKLAYAQFGDVEKHALTLTVGRQLIDYNNTIIGNSEWRNQARSFDAVVANVHVNRFRAALFAASAVAPMLNGISHRQRGNNIYGAYGWMTRVLPKSSIEPFVLWRVAPSVPVESGAVKSGRLDERAYGIRVRGTNLSNFDYRYEAAYEQGRAGSNTLAAWATTAGVGYSMHSVAWTARLFTGYDYASGDRNARDGRHGAFDTMYATAHDRFGITDQFGWQNIKSWRGGATITPHPRWSWTAQYLNLWLASATDAAYNSSGAPMFRDSTGRSGCHIGEEFDSYTWYEVNRQIHVGAGAGRLLSGEFMAKTGRRGSYTYPYVMVEILDGRRVR